MSNLFDLTDDEIDPAAILTDGAKRAGLDEITADIPRPAFLTGSQVYGKPGPDSDTDMVIFVSDSDLYRLCDAAGVELHEGANPDYPISHARTSLRFGKLNLIVCTDPDHYEAFRRATADAINLSKAIGRRLTKEETAESFVKIRREMEIE